MELVPIPALREAPSTLPVLGDLQSLGFVFFSFLPFCSFPNKSHEMLIKNASTPINISTIVSWGLHVFKIPLGRASSFSLHTS